MPDSVTPRLALPLLAAGQAQKEMSHNEALMRIDLSLHGSVAGFAANIPPASPVAGQCWILGAAPTGAWAGHPHEIAGWTEGGWRFLAPCEGARLWVSEADGFALFSGGSWTCGRAHGRLFVEGRQIIGPRAPAMTEPTGGVVVDAEARASILAVLNVMRGHGLVETD